MGPGFVVELVNQSYASFPDVDEYGTSMEELMALSKVSTRDGAYGNKRDINLPYKRLEISEKKDQLQGEHVHRYMGIWVTLWGYQCILSVAVVKGQIGAVA